jgi:hypothetical protein
MASSTTRTTFFAQDSHTSPAGHPDGANHHPSVQETVFHVEHGFIAMAAICNDQLDDMISASVSGLFSGSQGPASNAAAESKNQGWDNQLQTGPYHCSYSVHREPHQEGDLQTSRGEQAAQATITHYPGENDVFPISDEMAMAMVPEDWELQGIYEYVNGPSV